MPASLTEQQAIQTLEIAKNEFIAAPPLTVFECILEQMGPLNEAPDGTALQMTLEAWPGGRWFRDFGNNTGHFWGHVQSIKPGELLEIQGPMFMSAPVLSHVRYRLAAESGGTRLDFSHRAVGDIAPQYRDGLNVNRGWDNLFSRIRRMAGEVAGNSGKTIPGKDVQ